MPQKSTKIRIKATPNAKVSELVRWIDEPLHGRVLCIRIKAAPVEGKANKELVRFLSKLCKVPKSQIEVEKGTTSRIKTISLPAQAAQSLSQLTL